MTDAKIEGATPEAVALALLEMIAKVEKKTLYHPGAGLAEGHTVADRSWILYTYIACRKAVKDGLASTSPPPTAS